MTDYYGVGDVGTGVIGGYNSGSTVQVLDNFRKINLSYSRSIGLDVYPQGETTFSFDISFNAKYRRESLSQKTDNVGLKVSKTREQIRVTRPGLKKLR